LKESFLLRASESWPWRSLGDDALLVGVVKLE
jgi:hypothetical protein